MTPYQALEALHTNTEVLETVANLCGGSKDLHLISGDGLALLLDLILAKQREAVAVLQKQPGERPE